MNKIIPIKCTGAGETQADQLVDFQGDLKKLSQTNYEKLRDQILTLGFSEPISVWEDPEGTKFILNGHQRLKTILRMVNEEGFDMPSLPINSVEADDVDQAKRKVLSLTSQFGNVTEEGLHAFMMGSGITPAELSANFHLPEIQVPAFIDKFYPAPIDENDIASVPPPPSVMLGEAASGGVKMVQLFFDENTAEEFSNMIEDLKPLFGATNITDTVLAVVRGVHSEKINGQ